jgi:hypothetical protein
VRDCKRQLSLAIPPLAGQKPNRFEATASAERMRVLRTTTDGLRHEDIIHSFAPSLIHSFIHSFAHLLLHSLITQTMQRNRQIYIALILVTIAVGLFSRSGYVPEPITPYAGDILYTTMYFFIVGFLFPTMSARKVATLSILFCFGIEILQLYQADWIENIRSYRLGGLILGHGFLWSDLLCYSLGGALGWMVERMI